MTTEILNKAVLIAPALRVLLSTNGYVNLKFTEEEVGGNVLSLPADLDDASLSACVKAYIADEGTPDAVTVEGVGSFVCTKTTTTGRLAGKVGVVTGGAQGFGKGIAEAMIAEGAYLVIADMNYDGALATANELGNAIAVKANVSDEESVKEMLDQTVLAFGGVDGRLP